MAADVAYGRRALVTGATRGIGRAIALRLAADGCDVAVNYFPEPERDNPAEAEEVASLIRAHGRRALAVEADVADPEAVGRMVDGAIAALGGIDILVNNAGITLRAELHEARVDEGRRVLAVNLEGALNCSRAVTAPMRERGWGRIVSISSVFGQMGHPARAHYAASKAGLIGFTKALAREVAADGVTVNAVAPGFIWTEQSRGTLEGHLDECLALVPARRIGTPEDIASAVAYLVSDGASYITGHVLAVNGGMYM